MELSDSYDTESFADVPVYGQPTPPSVAADSRGAVKDVEVAPGGGVQSGMGGGGGAEGVSTFRKASVYGKHPLYVEAAIRRVYPWLAVQYGSCSPGGGCLATRTALVEMLCELVSGGGGGEEGGAPGPAVPEIVAVMVGQCCILDRLRISLTFRSLYT